MIENVVSMWAFGTIVLLTFALLVVWSRRDDVRHLRSATIVLALVCGLAVAVCIGNTLGYATIAWPGVTIPRHERLTILGVKLDPGHGIYLLVDTPDSPRLYKYPWDLPTAQKIQDMMQDPSQNQLVLDGEQGGSDQSQGSEYSSLGSHIEGSSDPRSSLPKKDAAGPAQGITMGD